VAVNHCANRTVTDVLAVLDITDVLAVVT